jgi:hypothetical protein
MHTTRKADQAGALPSAGDAPGAADKLGKAVNSIVTMILDPPGHWSGRDGSWTAHDVLAHLVFWHETYVSVLAALLNDEKPRLLTGSFRELNERAVRQNAGQPVTNLVERFRSA